MEAKGQVDESIAEFRKATELGNQQARPLLTKAERQAAARDKFADFENGRYTPTTTEERLALAGWCQTIKRNRSAARLYADAFAADPKLADDRKIQHRYDAVRQASLAASGQGKDAANLDEDAKASLRAQALGWLKAEFSAWERVAMLVEPGNKELVVKTLMHWKEDPDLSSVRDDKEIAKLPEAERKEWEKLWADVDAQLNRAQGQAPATAK